MLSSLEPLVWLPQHVLSKLLPNGSAEAEAFASSVDSELGWATTALHRSAANGSHNPSVSSSSPYIQPTLHDALGATAQNDTSAVPGVSGKAHAKLTWRQRLHLAPVPSAAERSRTQQPEPQTEPVSFGLASSLSDGGQPLAPSLPSLRHAMTRCDSFCQDTQVRLTNQSGLTSWESYFDMRLNVSKA